MYHTRQKIKRYAHITTEMKFYRIEKTGRFAIYAILCNHSAILTEKKVISHDPQTRSFKEKNFSVGM